MSAALLDDPGTARLWAPAVAPEGQGQSPPHGPLSIPQGRTWLGLPDIHRLQKQSRPHTESRVGVSTFLQDPRLDSCGVGRTGRQQAPN